MPASNYTANKILDLITRGVAFTPPSRVYISLHTADPGRTGANEVTTTAFPAYVRQDAALGGAVDTGFSAAASRSTKNAKQVLWAVHNGAGALTVSHWALWDASTAGNPLVVGVFSEPRTVQPADVFVVDVNKLTVTAD